MSKSLLEITPLSPTFAARVTGLDLAQPLGGEAIAGIRQALLKHEVLFFEDQDLTPQQQRDFAARFGELHLHPIRPSVPGTPEVLVLDNQPSSDTDTGAWRADVTFIETPPMGSMLYARHVPPEGGDTLWSSMRAAYAALSPSLRAFLQPLDAEHDFTRSFPPDHLASLKASGRNSSSAGAGRRTRWRSGTIGSPSTTRWTTISRTAA
jgi:taurine dioxygenase